MPRSDTFSSHRRSRFWLRLAALEREYADPDAVTRLKASVGTVARAATQVARGVPTHMPHYTLHDETHFLNVLWIMQELVPGGVLERLHPLECGLCIMAAYVHDLAMVLPKEEARALTTQGTPERLGFDQFCQMNHEPLVQRVLALGARGAPANEESVAIEAFLLEDYLRHTHTEPHRRVAYWLDQMSAGEPHCFEFAGLDFRDDLSLIATSHGQEACALRRTMTHAKPQPDGFMDVVSTGTVNWTFPALLLRLADVLDLDASRTPAFLYQSLGLEHWRSKDEAVRMLFETSWKEWSKHRSVVGWDISQTEGQTAIRWNARCDNPVVHNCLLDFRDWINAELGAVSAEFSEQRRSLQHLADWHYDLSLPGEVDFSVRPCTHHGQPAYEVAPDGRAIEAVSPAQAKPAAQKAEPAGPTVGKPASVPDGRRGPEPATAEIDGISGVLDEAGCRQADEIKTIIGELSRLQRLAAAVTGNPRPRRVQTGRGGRP